VVDPEARRDTRSLLAVRASVGASFLFPCNQQTTQVFCGIFPDVPGTGSGKQCPISLVGFEVFDCHLFAGSSGVLPCADIFSATVSWQYNLGIYPPFFQYIMCEFRQMMFSI
jgi:hypothetical protein